MASRLQGFVVLVFITFVACASVKKPVKRHQAYAKNGTQVNQRHQVRAPNITIESQTATQPKRSRGKHRRHVRTRTIKNASDSEVTEFSEQPVADSVLGAPDAVVSHDANYESDDRVDASRLLVAYCAAFSVVILCVSVMFYALGTAVVLQVVMYVGCLAVVKISLKLVYAHDFYYPKFITALHLFVSSTVGFCLLLNRKATSGQAVVVPTKDELLYGILPIASTFGLSIACDNSALVFASAAFSEVVASTNPVMSFALTWILGMNPNFGLLPPIAVVVLGCLISVEGEVYFSGIGFWLQLSGVFFRGLKATMQQKLLTGATKDKFDPVSLMAWTCMFACAAVFSYSLATDGLDPFMAIAASENLSGLVSTLLASSAIACTLNVAGLFVVKKLGAVGMQLVAQMKAILVVIGGMALLGESFTNMQKRGFAIVLAGVFWYSRVQRQAVTTASQPGSAK